MSAANIYTNKITIKKRSMYTLLIVNCDDNIESVSHFYIDTIVFYINRFGFGFICVVSRKLFIYINAYVFKALKLIRNAQFDIHAEDILRVVSLPEKKKKIFILFLKLREFTYAYNII